MKNSVVMENIYSDAESLSLMSMIYDELSEEKRRGIGTLRKIRAFLYDAGFQEEEFTLHELSMILIKQGMPGIIVNCIDKGLSYYYDDVHLISMKRLENLEFNIAMGEFLP